LPEIVNTLLNTDIELLMASNERIFHLSAEEVSQVLLCDDNDTEEGLTLDHENIQFLEEDLENHIKNSASEEVIEVTIETNKNSAVQSNQAIGRSHNSSSSNQNSNSASTTDTNFKWKKLSTNRQKSAAKDYLENQTDPDPDQFGQVLLELDDNETTPYQIFKQFAKFEKFLSEVVIPKTVLYSQQKGHVFSTSLEEMKAFFWHDYCDGISQAPFYTRLLVK